MLLGELRAEITCWWNKLVRQQRPQEVDGKGDAAPSNPGDTHIRLLTGGSELKTDADKKSLQSIGLKDHQVCYTESSI